MKKIKNLKSDCKGNESMQTILIMAIGALLLMGLNKFFNSAEVGGKIKSNVTEVLGKAMTIGGSTPGT